MRAHRFDDGKLGKLGPHALDKIKKVVVEAEALKRLEDEDHKAAVRRDNRGQVSLSVWCVMLSLTRIRALLRSATRSSCARRFATSAVPLSARPVLVPAASPEPRLSVLRQ